METKVEEESFPKSRVVHCCDPKFKYRSYRSFGYTIWFLSAQIIRIHIESIPEKAIAFKQSEIGWREKRERERRREKGGRCEVDGLEFGLHFKMNRTITAIATVVESRFNYRRFRRTGWRKNNDDLHRVVNTAQHYSVFCQCKRS